MVVGHMPFWVKSCIWWLADMGTNLFGGKGAIRLHWSLAIILWRLFKKYFCAFVWVGWEVKTNIVCLWVKVPFLRFQFDMWQSMFKSITIVGLTILNFKLSFLTFSGIPLGTPLLRLDLGVYWKTSTSLWVGFKPSWDWVWQIYKRKTTGTGSVSCTETNRSQTVDGHYC